MTKNLRITLQSLAIGAAAGFLLWLWMWPWGNPLLVVIMAAVIGAIVYPVVEKVNRAGWKHNHNSSHGHRV